MCPAELPFVLWSYKTTPRTHTGESPFSLSFGAEAVISFEYKRCVGYSTCIWFSFRVQETFDECFYGSVLVNGFWICCTNSLTFFFPCQIYCENELNVWFSTTLYRNHYWMNRDQAITFTLQYFTCKCYLGTKLSKTHASKIKHESKQLLIYHWSSDYYIIYSGKRDFLHIKHVILEINQQSALLI